MSYTSGFRHALLVSNCLSAFGGMESPFVLDILPTAKAGGFRFQAANAMPVRAWDTCSVQPPA